MTPPAAPEMADAARSGLVLFGAFDRHNFGDLLFPHVAAAMLGGHAFVAAGLVRRDMRRYGGHDVLAISDVANAAGSRRMDVLHAGGELLDCDAWEAAVMTSTEVEAQALANQRSLKRHEQLAWARSRLRLPGLAPYCLHKSLFANPGAFLYDAVGGVDLARRGQPFRAEVMRALREADAVCVRDHASQAQLRSLGIAAALCPDPAVMVAELFGNRIRRHAAGDEVAQLKHAFPGGYAAVQFSADFGDDATLDLLAAQFGQLPPDLGIVLFRAGIAPWHDDAAVYRRLIGRLERRHAALFQSLDIWDICALLCHARLYCGSSLHGHIVAHAWGVPGVSLVRAAEPPGKLAAYLATWHDDARHLPVEPGRLGAACRAALAGASGIEHARALAARYRDHFNGSFLPRILR